MLYTFTNGDALVYNIIKLPYQLFIANIFTKFAPFFFKRSFSLNFNEALERIHTYNEIFNNFWFLISLSVEFPTLLILEQLINYATSWCFNSLKNWRIFREFGDSFETMEWKNFLIRKCAKLNIFDLEYLEMLMNIAIYSFIEESFFKIFHSWKLNLRIFFLLFFLNKCLMWKCEHVFKLLNEIRLTVTYIAETVLIE